MRADSGEGIVTDGLDMGAAPYTADQGSASAAVSGEARREPTRTLPLGPNRSGKSGKIEDYRQGL